MVEAKVKFRMLAHCELRCDCANAPRGVVWRQQQPHCTASTAPADERHGSHLRIAYRNNFHFSIVTRDRFVVCIATASLALGE